MANDKGLIAAKPRYRYDGNDWNLTKQMTRNDYGGGWTNFATSLGVMNRDRTTGTRYIEKQILSDQELEAIYVNDGFAKRIIDLPVNEMIREWFTITGDTENLILDYLKELNTVEHVGNWIAWSRVFGGSVLLMGIDDGGDFQDPVDVNTINSIKFLRPFDKSLAIPDLMFFDTVDRRGYGEPQFYRLIPLRGSPFGEITVHASRVLRLDGKRTPARTKLLNWEWGTSVLQSCYDQIKNLSSSYSFSANIIADFILTIINIDNLEGLLSNKQGEATLLDRAAILEMTRSICNMFILGENEKITKLAANVSGLPELLDQFKAALSAVTGIPITLLMGQSPGGLNATGESDIRNWYDSIKSEQEKVLKPQLTKLVNYILLARDSPFGKTGLDKWEIQFNPLWQLSDTEFAQLYFQIAQGDNLYINNATIHPDEAATRFEGGKFNRNIKLLYSREPGDGLPPMPEDEDEPMQDPNDQNADNEINSQVKSVNKQIAKGNAQ